MHLHNKQLFSDSVGYCVYFLFIRYCEHVFFVCSEMNKYFLKISGSLAIISAVSVFIYKKRLTFR